MSQTQLKVFYGRIKNAGIITTRAFNLIEAKKLLIKRNEEINQKRVYLYGCEPRELTGVSSNLSELFPDRKTL